VSTNRREWSNTPPPPPPSNRREWQNPALPETPNQREGRIPPPTVTSPPRVPSPPSPPRSPSPTIPPAPPSPTSPPPTSPMPPPPSPPPTLAAKDLGVVKNPSRDVTNLASLVPQESAETITRLLFEQFSAVELSQILTSNTVDGVDQQYSIISNLSDIRRRYNSTKQLTIMDKFSPMDGVFAIDINSKIPGDDYIERNNLNTTYSYLDENNELKVVKKGTIYIESNGDLVIEFDNMLDDEFVQVQIDQNGTIYEVIKEWLQILEKILLQNIC